MALDLVLGNHAFTCGLSQTQIATLASLAREVVLEEDEVVLMHGQQARSFYLVLTGSVAIELSTPRFTVCVQALGPGQAFGWSALLDQQDTLFQVRSRQRTEVLRLDGGELAEACHADPQLGLEIFRRALKLVAGRVKATEARFAEMCGVRVDPLAARV